MHETYFRRRLAYTRDQTFPGWTKPVIGVQVFGFLAALVNSFYMGGGEFAWGEVKGWLFFTLAWLIAANLAYALYNWISAPGELALEDSRTIEGLKSQIVSPAKVEQRLRAEYVSKLKSELSSLIGNLSSFALSHGSPNRPAEFWDKFTLDIETAKSKAMELSFDPDLNDKCKECIHLASIIIDGKTRHEVNMQEREALNRVTLDVLKKLNDYNSIP